MLLSCVFCTRHGWSDMLLNMDNSEYGFGKYSNVKIVDKFGKWPKKKEKPYYSSVVASWFTAYWYSTDEKFNSFWKDFSGKTYFVKPTEFGYYSSGDPDYLKTTFTYLKNIGVEFVLIDDTNGHFVDEGLLSSHEDAMFLVADELGEKSVQIAMATGYAIYHEDFESVRRDLDAYYENYCTAYPDTYYKVDGKPLTVFYYSPCTDFTDDRFTVRYAAGLCSEQHSKYVEKGRGDLGLWGWCYDTYLPKAEVMGVQPGYNREHDQKGIHTVQRNCGKHYISLWLDAVKNNPRFISIASWNDHGEETSVEAANWPTDEDDFLYQKITEGYLALKYGCIDGFLYQSEGDEMVYKYSSANNKLVLQEVVPPASKEPVIIVPQDYFKWAGL